MRKSKGIKKVLSLGLSAILVASLLIAAFGTLNTMADQDNGDTTLPKAVSDVIQNTKPAGFDNAVDPYGVIGTDNTVTIYQQEELLMTDFDRDDHITAYTTEGLNSTVIGDCSVAFQEATTVSTASTSSDVPDADNPYENFMYTQCVAFDADGDDVKECVAYVGTDGDTGGDDEECDGIWAWYYNANTKTYSGLTYCADASYATKDLDYTYRAQSFYSITAGDYDGDGIDTVVIAYPGRDSENRTYPCVSELIIGGDGKFVFAEGKSSCVGYTNPAYHLDDAIRESDDYEDLLSIQLSTGDVNRDGIDDLVSVSYTNNISGDYDDHSTPELYVPWLHVGLGVEGSGFPATPDSSVLVMRDTPDDTSGDDAWYDVPMAANITCGDINGDYVDEIIVAGYYAQAFVDGGGSGNEWSLENFSNDYFITVAYTLSSENKLSCFLYNKLEANGWTSTDSATGIWTTADYAWQTCGLATAHLDGKTKYESVFINGSIYHLVSETDTEGTTYKFNADYTPDYFTSGDDDCGSHSINVTFIADAVAGNYVGSSDGVEQFAVMIGMKQSAGSANHYYIPAYIGKREVTETVTTAYYCTNIEESDVMGGEENDRTHLAAVDVDGDRKFGKFNSKDYFWSDPNVMSILQAAPYFGALGTYDDFNDGGTSVSISTSYSTASGSTFSQNIGAGFKGEFDLEIVSIELEVGYTGGYEEEIVHTEEHETSVTFTAGAYDTVIVQRAPVFIFYYDVWDPTLNEGAGGWIEKGMELAVTQEAKYHQLSIDDYNEFVEYYNDTLKKNEAKLKELNEDFSYEEACLNTIDSESLNLHQEGNPFGYSHDKIGEKELTLSQNGGSNAISYADSYETEITETYTHGFSIELAICTEIAEQSIGGFVSTELEWGSSSSTSVGKGTEIEGEVCGLDVPGLAEANDVDESIIRAFTFDWSFGTWKFGVNDTTGVQAPVYGYATRNVTAMHEKIDDLEVTEDDIRTLNLTWSAPAVPEDLAIGGYNIYMAVDDPDGEYEKLNGDTPVTDTTYDIKSSVYPEGKTLYLKVSTLAKYYTGGSQEYYLTEGMKSDPVKFTPNLSGKSAYEIAVDEGFDGTVTDWLSSLKGVGVSNVSLKTATSTGSTYAIKLTDGTSSDFQVTNGVNGKSGKSAYELALEEGFSGTLAQWLGSIKGETGVGISSITNTSNTATASNYTIKFTDGTSSTFSVANSGTSTAGTSSSTKTTTTTGTSTASTSSKSTASAGKSAYDIAVSNGFSGTETEWLESLKGDSGESLYDMAVENGFDGTEEEWIKSIIDAGSAGNSSSSSSSSTLPLIISVIAVLISLGGAILAIVIVKRKI